MVPFTSEFFWSPHHCHSFIAPADPAHAIHSGFGEAVFSKVAGDVFDMPDESLFSVNHDYGTETRAILWP